MGLSILPALSICMSQVKKISNEIWMLYKRFVMTFAFTVLFLPLLAFAECYDGMHTKQTENLQNILTSMPIEDRQDLECLFRYLMADGDFAYALFGDKPIAFSDFYVDLELGFFFNQSTLNSFATIYKGWLVWQKYKSSFPSNSFILMDYVSVDYKLIGFVLYHKQKVQALYDKHQPLMNIVFQDVDRIATVICSPTLEHLKLEYDKHLYHQALGLLLGYDATNAKRFRDKFELIDALMIGPFALEGLNVKTTETILLNLQDKKSIDSQYSNFRELKIPDIIRQLNNLSDNLKVINLSLRDETLSPIKIPKYMAFEGDQEVIARQKAYDKIRDRLIKIYFSENFLEIILSRLQS